LSQHIIATNWNCTPFENEARAGFFVPYGQKPQNSSAKFGKIAHIRLGKDVSPKDPGRPSRDRHGGCGQHHWRKGQDSYEGAKIAAMWFAGDGLCNFFAGNPNKHGSGGQRSDVPPG
jgi:hypothetical protein